MATKATRKKRRTRLSRMLFILVFTTVVMATDVLGTVPNNPLSAEIRQVFSAALPAGFTGDLNLELEKYDLPTLPPPPQQIPGNVNIFTVPGGTQESLDVLAELSDAFAPNPTVAITSLPTSAPTLAATVIPPTSVPTIAPAPTAFVAKESKLDMARTWELYSPEGDKVEKTFTIEKQGDAYAVTSVTSALGFVELVDQSWDGEKLTWKYNAEQGDGGITVFTVETTEFNICGCGSLGYLLGINITTGPDGFKGTEPVYTTGMMGVTELVPNADYSGQWKSVSHDDAGNTTFDYFTIEKQGDIYIVTSVSSDQEGDALIVYQSWDGEVLEWQYQRYGNETITLRTVGMDKAGILVVSQYGSWWGDDEFIDTGLFLEP